MNYINTYKTTKYAEICNVKIALVDSIEYDFNLYAG